MTGISTRAPASFLRSPFSSMEKSRPVILDLFLSGKIGLR